MVATENKVYVVPVRRSPQVSVGTTVDLNRVGAKSATIQKSANQSRGTSVSRSKQQSKDTGAGKGTDAQTYLDGLEAGQ